MQVIEVMRPEKLVYVCMYVCMMQDINRWPQRRRTVRGSESVNGEQGARRRSFADHLVRGVPADDGEGRKAADDGEEPGVGLRRRSAQHTRMHACRFNAHIDALAGNVDVHPPQACGAR